MGFLLLSISCTISVVLFLIIPGNVTMRVDDRNLFDCKMEDKLPDDPRKLVLIAGITFCDSGNVIQENVAMANDNYSTVSPLIQLPVDAHKLIILSNTIFYGSGNGIYMKSMTTDIVTRIEGVEGNVTRAIKFDPFNVANYSLFFEVEINKHIYYYLFEDEDRPPLIIAGLPDDTKLLATHDMQGTVIFGSKKGGVYKLENGKYIANKLNVTGIVSGVTIMGETIEFHKRAEFELPIDADLFFTIKGINFYGSSSGVYTMPMKISSSENPIVTRIDGITGNIINGFIGNGYKNEYLVYFHGKTIDNTSKYYVLKVGDNFANRISGLPNDAIILSVNNRESIILFDSTDGIYKLEQGQLHANPNTDESLLTNNQALPKDARDIGTVNGTNFYVSLSGIFIFHPDTNIIQQILNHTLSAGNITNVSIKDDNYVFTASNGDETLTFPTSNLTKIIDDKKNEVKINTSGRLPLDAKLLIQPIDGGGNDMMYYGSPNGENIFSVNQKTGKVTKISGINGRDIRNIIIVRDHQNLDNICSTYFEVKSGFDGQEFYQSNPTDEIASKINGLPNDAQLKLIHEEYLYFGSTNGAYKLKCGSLNVNRIPDVNGVIVKINPPAPGQQNIDFGTILPSDAFKLFSYGKINYYGSGNGVYSENSDTGIIKKIEGITEIITDNIIHYNTNGYDGVYLEVMNDKQHGYFEYYKLESGGNVAASKVTGLPIDGKFMSNDNSFIYFGSNDGAYKLTKGDLIATRVPNSSGIINNIIPPSPGKSQIVYGTVLPNDAKKIITHNPIKLNFYGSKNGAYSENQDTQQIIKINGIIGNVVSGTVTSDRNIYFEVIGKIDGEQEYYMLRDGDYQQANKILNLPNDAKLMFNQDGYVYFGSMTGAYELKEGELHATRVPNINGPITKITAVGPGKNNVKFDNGLPYDAYKIIIHNMRKINFYGSKYGAYTENQENKLIRKIDGINGHVISGIVTDDHFNGVYNEYFEVESTMGRQYYTLKDGETEAKQIIGLPTDAKLMCIHNLEGFIFFGSSNGAYELQQGSSVATKIQGVHGNITNIIALGAGKYNLRYVTV